MYPSKQLLVILWRVGRPLKGASDDSLERYLGCPTSRLPRSPRFEAPAMDVTVAESISNFIEGVLKKEIANKEVKHSRGRD